ncbi:MAG: hypothetical protein EHM37_16060, partial [Deltaproteobacteria bacterium]
MSAWISSTRCLIPRSAMTDRRRSKFRYDFFHDPSAVGGAAILAFFLLAALFAPLLAPHNPYDLTQVTMADALKPPVWRS